MMKDGDRALRVAALIKRELARLLASKVADPRIAGALVSDVEVSADLSLAKVYLLPAGSVGQARADPAELERAAGFLRAALSRRLDLRGVPRLRFLYDDSASRGYRIEQLLAEEKARGGQ